MKTFIVSLGIIILGVSALIFQTDIERYSLIDSRLLKLTEECAKTGVLKYNQRFIYDNDDETAGHWVFELDESGIETSVNYLISDAVNNSPYFTGGSLTFECELLFSSDVDTLDINGFNSVQVSLTYESNSDMFRLPFISSETITHTVCCGLKLNDAA